MLLDLLGTPNPRFYSYFEETDKWYARLADAEARLSRAGALEKYGYSSASSTDPAQVYFQPYSFRAGIEDDHIPFLRRNVSNDRLFLGLLYYKSTKTCLQLIEIYELFSGFHHPFDSIAIPRSLAQRHRRSQGCGHEYCRKYYQNTAGVHFGVLKC